MTRFIDDTRLVYLRITLGLSYEAISKEMDISIHTVWVHLHKLGKTKKIKRMRSTEDKLERWGKAF